VETTRVGFEARETVLLVKKSFSSHKSRKGEVGVGVVRMLQLFWPMFEAPPFLCLTQCHCTLHSGRA